MIRLVTLLFMVFILFLTTVDSQIADSFDNDRSYCCNSEPSARVVPVPQNVSELVRDSPSYGQVTTPTLFVNSQDSFCSTYFKVDDSTYMKVTGYRYSDGSCVTQKLILRPITRNTGVNRIEDPVKENGKSSYVTDQVYLGSACPDLKVYYTYFIAGSCDVLGNVTQVGADYVNAVSTCRDVSDYCKSQVAAVANSFELRGTQLVELPNRLNRCCVTQFNGASCFNADRVLPQDSVTVSNTSICSTIL